MKSLKSSYTTSSIVYILIGIALLLKPELSLRLVCLLFGAVILFKGVASIWAYMKLEIRSFFSAFTLIFGVITTALGVFLLFKPEMVVSVLPILVGLFIILDGLVRFQSAFELKTAGHSNWWSFLILALLSAGLGILMIANPFASVQVLVMAIGIILILEGAINLISSFYAGTILRSLRKTAERVADTMDELMDSDIPQEDPHEKESPVVDVDYRPVDDDK